jgi:hypothetical protein
MKREHLWLIVHLALGLAWIALLASRAPGDSGIGATEPQVFVMLVAAGWLPSLALAAWQGVWVGDFRRSPGLASGIILSESAGR